MFLLRADKKAPDASGVCPEGQRKVDRLDTACDNFKQAGMFICHSWGYWITPQLCRRNNKDRRCVGCPYKDHINQYTKNKTQL